MSYTSVTRSSLPGWPGWDSGLACLALKMIQRPQIQIYSAIHAGKLAQQIEKVLAGSGVQVSTLFVPAAIHS